MIISQRRIRSIQKYFGFIDPGEDLIIGLRDLDRFLDTLDKIGFSRPFVIGERVLPYRGFGPISSFNSEGKYFVHKNRPKETAYRQVEWHWIEFRGRYDTEEMSKIVDVPYERYPRTFIEPPSVEFTIANDHNGVPVLISDSINFIEANHKRVIHTVNLFLEIFGECEVLTQNLDGFVVPEIRRLHWEILPPGRYPWERLEKHVSDVIHESREGNWSVIEERFKTLNSYNPEFYAIGRNGFRGYLIFGFPQKNLFILESTLTGHATYVFSNDWESLSKMTKGEILNENLQTDRIIHRSGWENRVKQLLE